MGEDLQRFDIDCDLPDQFLAEFPPGMYLTPHTEMGDVTGGTLISLTNYFDRFNGLLTPRQLEGLRLLLTPFPQQQFNATVDRKVELPTLARLALIAIRTATRTARRTSPPIPARRRSATASRRCRSAASTFSAFSAERALKTVEDFTEFEQRTAYFDATS
jgi:hypothetical protein